MSRVDSIIRPIIGVPGIRSGTIAGLRRSGIVAADKVLDAITRAGGDPVIIPPCDPRDVFRRVGVCDGVVMPGGGDLDPSTYGAPPDDRTATADVIQDVFDLGVARAAVDSKLPFLAICRGMQVVNVVLGGTLLQHVPDTVVQHRDSVHPVWIEADSRVARAMGGQLFEVSSYHHQALERLGAGLHVAGRAEDGCIEVVEHDHAPVLAVQWHPEDDAELVPHQQGLFDTVVAQARQRMLVRRRLTRRHREVGVELRGWV